MRYERIRGESRSQQRLNGAAIATPRSTKLNDGWAFQCIDLSAFRFDLCVKGAHCHKIHSPTHWLKKNLGCETCALTASLIDSQPAVFGLYFADELDERTVLIAQEKIS